MIEILSNSPLNTVQDLGRYGVMNIGVGRSGAMDPVAARIGNWLVGNVDGAALIEVVQFPFRVAFEHPTRFSLTGASCSADLDGRKVPSWWTASAAAGQVLTVRQPSTGTRAYFAVGGGIDVPEIMGSRATDLKGGFGGVRGQGIARGTKLSTGSTNNRSNVHERAFGVAPREVRALHQALASGCVKLSVLASSEYDAFTAEALSIFVTHRWLITPESNRIGYRFAGESLALKKPLELRSHGIVPGVVQVPPSGQPMIQLAEANTCGGYPKIATVIESDLWKLGQCRPGIHVQFEFVDFDVALDIVKTHASTLATLKTHIDSHLQR